MLLTGTVRALRRALAFVALAAFGGAAFAAQPVKEPGLADVALLVSTRIGSGASGAPNPYSFADLFNLTIGAQYGLVSGTTVSLAGNARNELSQPSHLTPALFGGVSVPGVTLGTGPGSTSMIGISEAQGPMAGDRAFGSASSTGPAFEVERDIIPLGRIPDPAGWLIAASGLLVAGFIARRRFGSHSG